MTVSGIIEQCGVDFKLRGASSYDTGMDMVECFTNEACSVDLSPVNRGPNQPVVDAYAAAGGARFEHGERGDARHQTKKGMPKHPFSSLYAHTAKTTERNIP